MEEYYPTDVKLSDIAEDWQKSKGLTVPERETDEWKAMSVPELRHRLAVEIDEWTDVLVKDDNDITEEQDELLDIANICMMLYHRLERLPHDQSEGESNVE